MILPSRKAGRVATARVGGEKAHGHRASGRGCWTRASKFAMQRRDSCEIRNAAKDVWADSAYRAREREAELKARGYRSHIHHKGTRGHPLSGAKHATNTRRSKIRARVEHVFGRQAAMGGKLMRSIGIVRARANIGLKNLVYNLRRFVFLTKPAPA